MERIKVFVSKKEGARIPQYATEAASGMDLYAFTEEPVIIRPLERALIPTGIFLSIPNGYEGEIRPRSGLAYNYGITVLNTPGTIDSDYRGEIKVLLINLGDKPFKINNGDRIAQIVFKTVARVEFDIVSRLPESVRGEGGFGSTGI